MAFLRFRSVYCIPKEDFSIDQRHGFSSICICTATLSVYGACVQLKSWYSLMKDSESRRKPSSNPVMAFCLALADLFTCIGVIAMSILFITMHPPYTLPNIYVPSYGKKLNMTHPDMKWYKFVGVPIESLTMFGYISSYLWTFGYALDICLQIYDKDTCIKMRAYQLCFWGVPMWMVFWGQFGYLYIGGKNQYCSIKDQEIWHYMVCFVPLVFVFLVLPFIYFLAYRKVRKNVKTAHARFTNAERELLLAVKKKFLRIWLVFVFCWILNVVDGLIDLQVLFKSNPLKPAYVDENPNDFAHAAAHYGLWMAEALFNPLQGFLNCIVYGQSKMLQCYRQCCRPYPMILTETTQATPSEPSESFLINSQEALERSPLLQPRDSSRSLNRTNRNSHDQTRFVAKLLGEPLIT